jgi:hypothetical protein
VKFYADFNGVKLDLKNFEICNVLGDFRGKMAEKADFQTPFSRAL